MSNQKIVGRPKISDALEIVLFVDVGRKRDGLKVREFCALRSTKYWGSGTILPDGRGGYTINYNRKFPLQKDALRRRYAKAKQELMAGRPSRASRSIAYDPRAMNDARAVIAKMVDDLLVG